MANLEQDLDNVSLPRVATPDSGEDAATSNLNHDQFTPANCVICLDQLLQTAIALPCSHDNFHFLCLTTWLQRSRLCPLCKVEVSAIQYQEETTGLWRLFSIGNISQPDNDSVIRIAENPTTHVRVRSQFRNTESNFDAEANRALRFRKYVYEHKLYSLYIGSNAVSRYRNLTPHLFSHDERLLTKAKKWIRRELRVFDHLNSSGSYVRRCDDRRANNVEFLLNYIVAILKSIDLRGSAGQAEELLRDFLGRDTARLFLHELGAFLRSPYENLNDWDKNVQYSGSL